MVLLLARFASNSIYKEARHVKCKAIMQNIKVLVEYMLDELKNEGCNYNQYMCEHQFR